MKIVLDRYLIRLTFIISKEFKDSVGKILFPTDIKYFLRTWRSCWKDNVPNWYLLFLRIWRFYLKDILSHWLVSFFKNLKILLERYLIQLTFVIFLEFKDSVGKIRYATAIYCILRIWRFCWKDTLYHWNLLVLRIWRFCLKYTLS